MAANPYPEHFTDEYWWFVQQLQLLEPVDTVFAGAWGRNKPGGHCDAWYLYWHKVDGVYVWRNDYTLRHPDDKVVGTPLDQYGAATDWTFKSAQRGDFTNISKYGRRIAVAFANRDPRLEGWHEVLIQADMDKAPEGFNFRSWTTRQPDVTHEWHGHFTCSRKFLKVLRVFQAMISILKGETLARWLAGGDKDTMATVFLYDGKYRFSRGDATSREDVKTAAGALVPVGKESGEMNVLVSAHRVYPPEGAASSDPIKGYPTIDLKTQRQWTDALVDLTFGPMKGTQPPPSGGGVTIEQVHDAIASSTITPPGGGQ